jgi:hypothetical protein
VADDPLKHTQRPGGRCVIDRDEAEFSRG